MLYLRGGPLKGRPHHAVPWENSCNDWEVLGPRDGSTGCWRSRPTRTLRRSALRTGHRVRRGETLSHIARRYGTSVATLKQHNRIRNVRRLRAGQTITIAGGHAAPVVTSAKRTATNTPTTTHRVRRGETLSHIARRYGTSVGTLKQHNRIRNVRRLRAGQTITIPVHGASLTATASATAPRTAPAIRHRVRRRQTLTHIARDYGTTVGALKRENRIRDARRLRAGQIITIPADGSLQVVASLSSPENSRYITHRVRRGQTLSHIARGRSANGCS